MLSLLLLSISCCLSFTVAQTVQPYALEHAEIHFENFIQEYNKQYVNEYEKQARFQIFKNNLENVIRMNENSKNAVYGITQFMDLTLEEFHNWHTGFKLSENNDLCSFFNDSDIIVEDAPEFFDWRVQGVVSPVKNQLKCASCYVFSAIGNIEGQYAIKNNKLVEFSEQQVIDCNKRNSGCRGGVDMFVYRYAIEAGGLETEDDYVYTGHDDKCQFDASKVRVKLADCHAYKLTSQEKLKQLLYHNGPLSIAIQGNALGSYKGGIISDEECDQGSVNHAVLLVGYGEENGVPYWIVKNSWGAKWGDNGYLRIHRAEDASSCGMMHFSSTTSVLV